MKLHLIPTLAVALVLGACSQPPESVDSNSQGAKASGEGSMESSGATSTPDAKATGMDGGAMHPVGAANAAGVDLSGKVLETMQSGGYTYVRLKTAKGEVWAAGTAHNVTEGAQLIARGLTPMPGFRSATLDRTFEQIFFCDSMMVTGANAAGHPVAQDVASSIQVEKAEGGQTVAQMFTEKDAFVGKQVTLRGKVVKFSAAIMGKNWIHLQDGSGEAGTNDLTITTAQTVAVGDTVTVQGTLVADKDFGYGYKYAVIIEDAKVTVE